MKLDEKKTTPQEPKFEFRLRPVATPSGFRYHVDARPTSIKYVRIWRRLTDLPISKAEATKLTNDAVTHG